MSGKAGRGADQFMVRLPPGMRDRIKAAADANNRSMNAEIVHMLHEKYPDPPPDEEELRRIELFNSLPEEVRDRLILDFVEEYVSREDIEEGLIRGIVLRKD